MKTLKKILSLTLALTFISTQLGFAQVAVDLNIASYLSRIQAGMAYEKFRAPHLRYFSYDNATNNFGLILDKGDLKDLKGPAIEESGKELLQYFLIGVILPDENFWVNLRPDSKDNIIPELLAQTDLGKILLEADVQLKKDTAQLTSPNAPQGKLYWDKLYKKANELFGSDNISIPTLTRPWIVPGEIIIRESKDSAYIYKANLKVMLEEDHLKNSAVYSFKDPRQKALNDYSSQLIRELIIPQMDKEVNNAKRYASLRQAYYSLILARWFKNRFYGRGGLYASNINRANLEGLTSSVSWSKDTYFKAYQDSFNNGEYNIKTPINTLGGSSIRSYFSGGIDVGRNLNFSVQGGSSPIAAFTGKGAFLPAARNIGLVPLTGQADINLVNNLKISSSPIDESASSPIDYEKISEELNKNSIGMRLNRKYLFEIMDSKRFFVNINDIKEEMKDLKISEATVKAALDLWFGDKYAITSTSEKIKTGIDGQVQEKVVGFSLTSKSSSSPLEKETKRNTSEPGADDSNEQELERLLETAKSSLRLQNMGLTPVQLQEAIKNNPSMLLSIVKALDEEGSYKYKNLIKYISNSMGEAAKKNPSVSGMINEFLSEDSASSPIQLSLETRRQLEQIAQQAVSSPAQNNYLEGGRADLLDMLLNAAPGSTMDIENLKEQLRINDADIKDAIRLANSLNDSRYTGMNVYSDKGLIRIPWAHGSDSSSPVEEEGMKKGGIDFRALPMTCKPSGGFCGLNFALPKSAEVASINVDKELNEINLMVERGIAPSGERIKELVAACYHKHELASRQEELMSCLMRICKLEEDMVVSSGKELKEAIVIVDSL